jgi:ABC-type Fe3+/spermidine/putrescine transport system ATPase subunit
MAELEITRVHKRYGSVAVLDDVSLQVSAGAYVALLGPSGSGKSTLLRAIAGLAPIDAGDIRLAGRSITALPPEQRELGMVFQSYAVWPHLNVRENVAYPLRLRRDRSADAQADDALARVGLSGFGDRAPSTLSGGQQQRVALARALVMRPKALLLDEPLANLDPHLRADLCDQFRQICSERGLTFVHVTHDREEALGLATVLVLLRDGRIVQQGAPDELFHRPADRFVAEFVAEGVTLKATRAGPERMRLEDGAELSARGSGDAYVVIPRHALRLSADGPLAATVEGSAYAGASWTLAVHLVGGVKARVKAPDKAAPGTVVRLDADVAFAF